MIPVQIGVYVFIRRVGWQYLYVNYIKTSRNNAQLHLGLQLNIKFVLTCRVFGEIRSIPKNVS